MNVSVNAKLLGGCEEIAPNTYRTVAMLPCGQIVPVTVRARLGYCYGCSGGRGYDKLSSSGVMHALATGTLKNDKQGYVPVKQNSRGQWETLDSFYAQNPFFGETVEGWTVEGKPMEGKPK